MSGQPSPAAKTGAVVASSEQFDGAAMALVDDLFGTRWDLWATDGGLRRIRQGLPRTSPNDPSVSDAVLRQIAQTAANGTVLFHAGQGEYLCTVPLTHGRHPWVALGRLSHQQAAELLSTLTDRRLHRTAGRPTGSGCPKRVPSDQWEWLVHLPASLAPGPTEESLQETAARILPALRHLMQAQSVVLQELDQNGGDRRRWRIVWTDGEHIPEEDLNRLTEPWEPEIANLDGSRVTGHVGKPPKGRPDSIPSVIQVPVSRPGRPPGRLMATFGDSRSAGPRLSGVCEKRASSEWGVFRDEERGLLQAAASALETNCGIQDLLQDRRELLIGIVRSLVNVLDAKDSYTSGHSDRVAEYARLTAWHLGLSGEDCDQICLAGLLHDIGKVAIPDDILNKPGRLTREEARLVRQHPVTGYEILRHLKSLSGILPGVLHHHESWDGTGYPDGLAGSAIPLQARILAVADAWDAMTSRRPYRAALPVSEARQILQDGAGTQWDPECVSAALRCIDTPRLRLDASHHRLSSPEFLRQALLSSLSRRPAPPTGVRS